MSDENYQFKKHFTVEEANTLLPHILSVFERIHALGAELSKHSAVLEGLHANAPGNGGSKNNSEVIALSESITTLMTGLEVKGILIKDVEAGLIDFPHIRDEHEVMLCWRLGERKVEFWHELDAGFRGRQPL